MPKLSLFTCFLLFTATISLAKTASDPYQHLFDILGEAEDIIWEHTLKRLTALLHGIERDTLKKFIRAQGEPDLYDALYWAVYHSDTRFVTWLLQHGADPNTLYHNMTTPRPLFVATESPVAATLLDHGADPQVRNYLNQSLLHTAISPCHVKDNALLELYVQRGLLPEQLPDNGASLWHILVDEARWTPEEHYVPRAQLLAKLGVPAHVPSPTTGQTPTTKVKHQIRVVSKSFEPFVFGQASKLARLLAVLRKVVK